jgi:hypothetical protein
MKESHQTEIYEPVREFEKQTSYCPRKAAPRCEPLYLARRIVDEARGAVARAGMVLYGQP